MCKQSGESINHFLHHCEVAHALLSVVLTLFDVTFWRGRRFVIGVVSMVIF
jgi:hypothetical protein